MRKTLKIFAAALIGMAAVACSSAEKMAELADNVTVKCDPAVLECVAGNIDATVTVTIRRSISIQRPSLRSLQCSSMTAERPR